MANKRLKKIWLTSPWSLLISTRACKRCGILKTYIQSNYGVFCPRSCVFSPSHRRLATRYCAEGWSLGRANKGLLLTHFIDTATKTMMTVNVASFASSAEIISHPIFRQRDSYKAIACHCSNCRGFGRLSETVTMARWSGPPIAFETLIVWFAKLHTVLTSITLHTRHCAAVHSCYLLFAMLGDFYGKAFVVVSVPCDTIARKYRTK